jgi:phosphoribosyl-ATP pyrophosphohydrolase
VIVPSIDLRNGRAVQLRGGKEQVLDAGDPRPIAERFAVAGEIAVVDLDAALGTGSNEDVIRDLLGRAPCRVGGGIRTAEAALAWLDAGATKVVLGTAAVPEVLERLPRERVIAALDAEDGDVVVEGWTKKTGRGIVERIEELRDLAGGFLVTFVEREGRLGGTDLARVEEIVRAASGARVTIAGGVTTPGEIAALDRFGADAQVGMAIYTGRLDLADALAAPLTSDRPDGLWPTVVCDERGVALGLAWSDAESLREAVRSRRGVYHSRRRGLWVKGESTGATQDLLRVAPDCDRDALRFTVRQAGSGFCHESTRTCWGDDPGLGALARLLDARREHAPAGSYTKRLFDDAGLLDAKILEEAGELVDAREKAHVAAEAADLLYFILCALSRAGVPLEAVERELAARSLKVHRRPGDAKEHP